MQRANKLTTDYFPPNHAQLSKAIVGHDPNYRIRPKRSIYRSYFILIFAVLLAVFGTFFVIASAR